MFYKQYLSKGIDYTKDLLYDKTNVDSFNTLEGERRLNFYFLTWTGLRHAVPSNLRTHPHSFAVVLDLENFKCRDYYSLLIKFKYENQTKNEPRDRKNLIWKIIVFKCHCQRKPARTKRSRSAVYLHIFTV